MVGRSTDFGFIAELEVLKSISSILSLIFIFVILMSVYALQFSHCQTKPCQRDNVPTPPTASMSRSLILTYRSTERSSTVNMEKRKE